MTLVNATAPPRCSNTAMRNATEYPAASRSVVQRLLRWLPPPRHLAAPLRLLPEPLFRQSSTRVIAHVLAAPLAAGRLDEFVGRRIGVEATDLGLRWIVAFGERRIDVVDASSEADAMVRGTATDLLLLASRIEDADTLFFHRRLELTGDVELGLAVRNLFDQLPWDTLPLGLRIAVNRGARLASSARDAYRSAAP